MVEKKSKLIRVDIEFANLVDQMKNVTMLSGPDCTRLMATKLKRGFNITIFDEL